MKGLIRKDLYMIWNYGRMLLIMSLVFLFTSAVAKENTYFFVIYPVLFSGVLPVTLLSYDERFGWNRYCDTLPVSRRTVVNERYLMTLLSFLALYLLTLAVQAVVKLPQGRGGELWDLVILLPAFGLISPAVMLPITFRFGVEKARIAYYVLIGVIVVLGISSFNSTENMSSELGFGAFFMILAATAVLFVASLLLSQKLYANKEL